MIIAWLSAWGGLQSKNNYSEREYTSSAYFDGNIWKPEHWRHNVLVVVANVFFDSCGLRVEWHQHGLSNQFCLFRYFLHLLELWDL